ncbi:hypothetical protein ACTVCO_09385 [Sanguibacter sp. A247]|uniref:hypothetical protein n=1 Tax=unclassified Sanguibacter TaxID=2645534 RepID=UPI003FD8431F
MADVPEAVDAADAAQRDQAERMLAAALLARRNDARIAEHESARSRHRVRRHWLVLLTTVVGAYELVWWIAAFQSRDDALDASDIEVLLRNLQAWTTVAGAHWFFTVAAFVTLGVLWRRHVRRRPVAPCLELALDDPARRHPSFGPDATARRRII